MTIDFDPQTEARLEIVARQRGIDTTELVKRLVAEHYPITKPDDEIGDYGGRSVFEVFGHLFGTVEGGIPDLSTNPKYMEGFGETKNLRNLE